MAKAAAARKSVQRYRQRMRRSGFRLVQLWVPDVHAAGFTAECRRQSRIAARAKRSERDILRWIEANQDIQNWTA